MADSNGGQVREEDDEFAEPPESLSEAATEEQQAQREAGGTGGGGQQQGLRVSIQLTPRAAQCLAVLNTLSGSQNPQDLSCLKGMDESEFGERVRELARSAEQVQLSEDDIETIISELSPIVKQLNDIYHGRHPQQQQQQQQQSLEGEGERGNAPNDQEAQGTEGARNDQEPQRELQVQRERQEGGDGRGGEQDEGRMEATEGEEDNSKKRKMSKEERKREERRKAMHKIRVRMLRVANRLGQGPRNSVVAQALQRMELAEQLKSSGSGRAPMGAGRPQGPGTEAAQREAESEEESGEQSLGMEMTVLAIGKTGVGKSATLNSLFGTNLHTDHFERGTKKAELAIGEACGVKVRLIDTPGLGSNAGDMRDNWRVIGQAKRLANKRKPDIVLYFDRLDTPMRDLSDLQLLRSVTSVFGSDVWFNAIVVLTHASKAPPEDSAGRQINYEQYMQQRSHMVQQIMRQASGDTRLMNPVALAENHPQCRTNSAGQQVLPNGQAWKPQLLILCFASKLLADANRLLNLNKDQKNQQQQQQQKQQKSPPLPFLLSNLIQSRQPHKMDSPAEHEEDFEEDQAPDQEEQQEEQDEEEQGKGQGQEQARQVSIPAPDPALPPSFDVDNPSYRYRFLESANQWVVRPVVEAHGWDHEAGVEGFKVEKSGVGLKGRFPGSLSGQLSKDKQSMNVQSEAEGSYHHTGNLISTPGLDIQNVSSDTIAYTARTETRWRNFTIPRTGGTNKTALGGACSLVSGMPAGGIKIEERIKPIQRAKVVACSGVVAAKNDKAFGGNLEASVKHSSDPSDPLCTTLSGSFMRWRGDLAVGANGQSQFDLLNVAQITLGGNLNSRGSGKFSIRASSNENLVLGVTGVIPVFFALLSRIRGESD